MGLEVGLIVGVHNCEKNIHDSKTVASALEQFKRVNGYLPEASITDRGFGGKAEVMGVKVSIPKPGSKKASAYQKWKARQKFRKRAGIEPIISHLKSDFRLKRNYLSRIDGDRHHLIMSAAAFNIRKWVRSYLKLLKIWLQFFRAGFRLPIHQYQTN